MCNSPSVHCSSNAIAAMTNKAYYNIIGLVRHSSNSRKTNHSAEQYKTIFSEYYHTVTEKYVKMVLHDKKLNLTFLQQNIMVIVTNKLLVQIYCLKMQANVKKT